MKIVDVCGFYTPFGGGIRTYIEQKLRLAEQLGHDITVLAPGVRAECRVVSSSARIEFLPSPHFLLDRKYFAFADEKAVHCALDRLKPDLIEASSPWRSANYVASYPGPVPRALIMHSDPLSAHAYRWFERVAEPTSVDRAFDWFWRRLRTYGQQFDLVVSANRHLSERLITGGVANVATVPMGVEQGLFSPAHRDEDLRRDLLASCALGPDATLLIAAGRLATEKRVPMLVDAATRAGRKRPIALAIFGEGRTLPDVIRAIAGNPHVRVFAPVRDRQQFARLLASADALLHGCEAETFGMVAAEATASGLRVVAPLAGGVSDFARLTPGLGFTPLDAVDASRAILQLPVHGQAAPWTAEVRTMAEHLGQLFDHYHDLASQGASKAA
ncbi:glycosyltransferase [Tsuneonella sp. YG55]|uniref:Glycosyltransferase n=1 Tax=Tsuneonella litorea TaxID=2976475 RepID=A0A9X2W3J9_9SPHN|nr:glycosyltransferase [Tsuneonella litorea]MCT2560196.1 glycosyltransferase [Tsuneonella litorea]